MRIPLVKLLSYYRNSLADADRMAPEDSWVQTATPTNVDEWASGQLSPETLEMVWQARSGSGKADTDEWGRRRFWLCPFVGTLKPEHGARRHGLPVRIVPLWFPVRVSENGNVEPDPQLLPWIPRTLLEPIHPARIVLGQLTDADTYVAARMWEDPEALTDETGSSHRARRLSAWLEYGKGLLEFVTKKEWATFELEEYYREPHAVVLPAGAPSAKITGLLAYYDALIRDKISTPPLQRFVAGESFPPEDPLASDDDPRALHVAHLPTHPPLSNDQREAMHKALVHHPDVLAVNGPPGTGKTRWVVEYALQTWVEAALNEDPYPPIQLWLAGTNQAIHASLETLQTGLLNMRWGYPEIKGLGIWCAAKSQQKDAVAQRDDWLGFKWQDGLPEGSPASWGSEVHVIDASQQYLDNASKHFGRHVELAEAKSLVLNELRKSVDPLRTTWRLLRRDKQRKLSADSILQAASWPTGFEEYSNHLNVIYQKRKKALERIRYIFEEWEDHVERTPLWLTFTASLPGAPQRIKNRNKAFFDRFKMVPRGADLKDVDSVTEALKRLLRDIESLYRVTEKELNEVRRVKSEKESVGSAWSALSNSWAETPRWYDDGTIDSGWENRCDNVYRSNATMWALRYWEATFLEKRIAYFQNTKQQRVRSRLSGWQELACLTPMLAATVHSAPRFFQEGYSDTDTRPFYGFAQRIIIEEASQVAPDVTTGLLALARSSVLVGDEKQLQPVWGVPEKTDVGNLMQMGLISNVEDSLIWKKAELLSSSGTALKRANMVGLSVHLHEQHRSHPDLVAFANRLAYDNKIVSTRVDNDPSFPAFAYAHVIGQPDTQWGSKNNKIEAVALADFLVRNSWDIKSRYHVTKLGDAVGIITPFLRQVQTLRTELQKRLQPDDMPHIGTVHAYQGAEKPVIIFSAVQPIVGMETPFFDTDASMLNVAVSRARDAFWYVGNLNGLNPKGLRPSSILAQSLIKGTHQRIYNWHLPSMTTHGLDLEQTTNIGESERDEILCQFINDVQGVLHIASPVVDPDVLERIKFWQLAHQATLRGAQIIIHCNRFMMTYHGNGVTSDLQRSAAISGVKWEMHPTMFDSRIWDANRMGESSEPWLAPLHSGNFALYKGAVSWWCNSQMGSWGSPKNGTTFGEKNINDQQK